MDLSPVTLAEYRTAQVAAKRAPATINRGLQSLRAALRLAKKAGVLPRAPYLAVARERNARTGFFEVAEHLAIKANLPAPYDAIAEFGHLAGWRLGEILPL